MKNIIFFLIVLLACTEIYAQEEVIVGYDYVYRDENGNIIGISEQEPITVYRDKDGKVIGTLTLEPIYDYIKVTKPKSERVDNNFDLNFEAGYSMCLSGPALSGFYYGLGMFVNNNRFSWYGTIFNDRYFYYRDERTHIGYWGFYAFRYMTPDAHTSDRFTISASIGAAWVGNYIYPGYSAVFGYTAELSRDFRLTNNTSLIATVRFLGNPIVNALDIGIGVRF